MTILVTGSNGLVGSAIRRNFADDDIYFATRQDADLTDFEQAIELFSNVKPTRVIHLAALVGGIGGNLMHGGEYFRNNTLINLNVLEAARITKVKKLVSFMSTCVFPNNATYPLTVEQIHLGPPHPSNFGYAYAKRMLDVQSRAYRDQWGADYVVAIPTNIYGPNDNWSLTEGHVVPALIHRMFLAKAKNEPLKVWGSGQPLREFIYSGDIAKLVMWMATNYNDSEPIILTQGVETSIHDLVQFVAEAMEFSGKVVYDISKPDGQFRKPSDPSALLSALPEFDFTRLQDGIQKTVEWFRQNYPNVRV